MSRVQDSDTYIKSQNQTFCVLTKNHLTVKKKKKIKALIPQTVCVCVSICVILTELQVLCMLGNLSTT